MNKGLEPDAAPRQGGGVLVELDVFSGRPNPTWPLSADQRTVFLQRLNALPPFAATEKPATSPQALGYRGLRIRTNDSDIHIYAGAVCVMRSLFPESWFADPRRSLEEWLLQTGRNHIDSDLLNELQIEIRSEKLK